VLQENAREITKNEHGGVEENPLKGFVDGIIGTPFDDVVVSTEVGVSGQQDRWDVDVSFKQRGIPVHIILENKVCSPERPNQTQKYFFQVEGSLQPGHHALFVYLTAADKVKVDHLQNCECSCAKFVQICYQDIVDVIIDPALTAHSDSPDYPFLLDYCQSLGPILIPEEDLSIMALGRDTKNVLTTFWNRNKSFFNRRTIQEDLQSLDENQLRIISIVSECVRRANADDKTRAEELILRCMRIRRMTVSKLHIIHMLENKKWYAYSPAELEKISFLRYDNGYIDITEATTTIDYIRANREGEFPVEIEYFDPSQPLSTARPEDPVLEQVQI